MVSLVDFAFFLVSCSDRELSMLALMVLDERDRRLGLLETWGG